MDKGHRPQLRRAVAQFDALGGDVDHNMCYHMRLLGQASADCAALAVFPDLSVSGYCSGERRVLWRPERHGGRRGAGEK